MLIIDRPMGQDLLCKTTLEKLYKFIALQIATPGPREQAYSQSYAVDSARIWQGDQKRRSNHQVLASVPKYQLNSSWPLFCRSPIAFISFRNVRGFLERCVADRRGTYAEADRDGLAI